MAKLSKKAKIIKGKVDKTKQYSVAEAVAATLIVLPVSVFAFFVRKSIVQGLTMGALKD